MGVAFAMWTILWLNISTRVARFITITTSAGIKGSGELVGHVCCRPRRTSIQPVPATPDPPMHGLIAPDVDQARLAKDEASNGKEVFASQAWAVYQEILCIDDLRADGEMPWRRAPLRA